MAKVIKVKVGEFPTVIEIDCGLKSLQEEVGGRIELCRLPDVDIICHDEGKFECRPNRGLYEFDFGGKMPSRVDIIFGDFLITACGEDGELVDLPDEMISKYLKRFGFIEHWIEKDKPDR